MHALSLIKGLAQALYRPAISLHACMHSQMALVITRDRPIVLIYAMLQCSNF